MAVLNAAFFMTCSLLMLIEDVCFGFIISIMRDEHQFLCLLGGGSGFVGQQLTRYLQGKGFDVTIISRTPSKHSIKCRTLTWVRNWIRV